MAGLPTGFALPQIAGMDMAGTVVELGSDVSGINIGDRVVVDPSLHAVSAQSSFAGQAIGYGVLGVLGATHPVDTVSSALSAPITYTGCPRIYPSPMPRSFPPLG